VIRNNGKRRNRDSDKFCLCRADSQIAALSAPAGKGVAERQSELFFCASKNVRTTSQKLLSFRRFAPALEVAEVLQIAGPVSRSRDAAQANDWKSRRRYSTHAPNYKKQTVVTPYKSLAKALAVTEVIVESKQQVP